MANARAPIFDDVDLDVDQFKPNVVKADTKGQVSGFKQAAEHTGFTSREPASIDVKRVPREQRRHRTGRNQQLNLKVTEDALERFYAIATRENVVLGRAFELAVDALERELAR